MGDGSWVVMDPATGIRMTPGPDQCSQSGGRWKLGGDGSCYWDANDSGAESVRAAGYGISGRRSARRVTRTLLHPGV